MSDVRDDSGAEWEGYGFGEIAFLVSQVAGEAASQARDLFDFSDSVWSPEVQAAAASSLYARGCLSAKGEDELVPEGGAAYLAYCLSAAIGWSRFGFFDAAGEVVDGAIMIDAPDASVLLQPRNYGSWIVMLRDPAVGAAESAFELADGFLKVHADGHVFISHTSGTQWQEIVLSREHGGWRMRKGSSAVGEAEGQEGASGAAVLDVLVAMMGNPAL